MAPENLKGVSQKKKKSFGHQTFDQDSKKKKFEKIRPLFKKNRFSVRAPIGALSLRVERDSTYRCDKDLKWLVFLMYSLNFFDILNSDHKYLQFPKKKKKNLKKSKSRILDRI